MKILALALVVLGFVALAPAAEAAYCHAGVYRSGCVSRYGTTVRRHRAHYGANRCFWRAGRRVCY